MSDEEEPIDGEEPDVPLNAPDDAASPKGLKRKRRRKADVERDSTSFWKGVFADRIGRREMYALLAESGLKDTFFAVGPNGFPQLEASMYKRGSHDYGYKLFLQWLRVDRLGVMTMLDENDPYFMKNAPPVEES